MPDDETMDLGTAARALNIGVDALDRLVAEGMLRAEVTGERRRLRRAEALTFKSKRDAERREGLRELTRLTEKFGGYDREMANDEEPKK